MSAPQLAAFVDGWTSLLELLKRPEVCMPDAPESERQVLVQLVEDIETAQRRALGDDPA